MFGKTSVLKVSENPRRKRLPFKEFPLSNLATITILNSDSTANVSCKYSKNFQNSLHKKMNFSVEDFFSKCDQIRSFLRIWLHLLKKSFMESFIFCAVIVETASATE